MAPLPSSLRAGVQRPLHVAPARNGRLLTSCQAVATVNTAQGSLSKEQVAQFHKDGYLVLKDFSSPAEVAAVRRRAVELAKSFHPDQISIFSTRNQANKKDQYFLDSASNASCFLEEKALDQETGELRQAKELSINKIGHALHDMDPTFRAFSRSPKVAAVVRSLGYVRPLPVQSQFIFKQPSIGGEVVPHQDSTFLHTLPLSCTALWWALEDSTTANGCLWAQAGVHKDGLLRRFFRSPEGVLTFDVPAPKYELGAFVPLEMTAGSMVLLHGENIHYSCENTSPISRHSYSMHVVEGAAGTQWTADNWAQRTSGMPWEPLYE